MTDFGLDGLLRCQWPADGHHPRGGYGGHLERGWPECGAESDGTQVSNLMAVTLWRLYVCPEHRQLALDSRGWQEHPPELCRRCGTRPGRWRSYVPGEPGQTKVSARQTVGCEPCWQGFLEQRGVPVRVCCGKRHEDSLCPDDGLVMCQLCFERVPLSQLHVVDDRFRGQTVLEDVCRRCAANETAEPGRMVGRASFSGEVHLVPLWRSLPDWVAWLVLWLLGAVLVVLGGGWQGFLAGVGLLVSGAGMGLLVRRVVEGP